MTKMLDVSEEDRGPESPEAVADIDSYRVLGRAVFAQCVNDLSYKQRRASARAYLLRFDTSFGADSLFGTVI
jgi:hypothetical protein